MLLVYSFLHQCNSKIMVFGLSSANDYFKSDEISLYISELFMMSSEGIGGIKFTPTSHKRTYESTLKNGSSKPVASISRFKAISASFLTN